MPFHKERYPDNWKDISRRIRERSGGRCECAGECRGAKYSRCDAINGFPHPATGSRVVLTVAHLNHNTTDNRDENLKAMCQRCHLSYDAKFHAKNAAQTRRRKKIQQGQLEL